jgi:hypothetical protein
MTYDSGDNCVVRCHSTDGHSGLTPDRFCQCVNDFLCFVMPSAVPDCMFRQTSEVRVTFTAIAGR